MMNDVAIHDRFFKSVLGLPGPLGSVLRAFLPPEVAKRFDPGSLVFLPTESMGEVLDASFMDLVFSARFDGQEGRVQIIVEHKSSPDSSVYFQVAHYATGLWVRNLREGGSPLPVLPVLFYHGVRPWNLPGRLSEVVGTPGFLKEWSPDFSLAMIDMGRIEDREIRLRVEDFRGVLALLALKHIFGDPETCLRILFRELKSRNASYDIIKPELDYVSSYLGHTRPEELKALLDPIIVEEGMATNIVDTWIEEGIQKGIQQGIQKGIQEGIQEGIQKDKVLVVKNLLHQGILTPEQIAQAVGVEASRVLEIAREESRKS